MISISGIDEKFNELSEKIDNIQLVEKPFLPVILTPEQVQAYLSISHVTLKKFRDEGAIKYIQRNNTIRYDEVDLLEFLNTHKVG